MLKKIFIICLIGLIGMIFVPNTAWAHAFPGKVTWLAQSESTSRMIPSEQLSPASFQETVKPSTDASKTEASSTDASKTGQTSTTPVERKESLPSEKARSQSKPFNPYDMKALKQFDKGSHRAK